MRNQSAGQDVSKETQLFAIAMLEPNRHRIPMSAFGGQGHTSLVAFFVASVYARSWRFLGCSYTYSRFGNLRTGSTEYHAS